MEIERLKRVLKGVCVVMVTPFDEKLNVDIDSLRRQVRFIVDNGIKEGRGVIISTGSTGECPMLTIEERKKILEVIVEEARGEVPIIAGCNHTSTLKVIELVKHAESVGASGAMISPPYYWAPTEEVIIEHYKTIAKATKLGITVYNNHFASQVDIPLSVLKKLIEIDNIVGFKENTPLISKLIQVVKEIGDKVNVINGSGERNEPFASFIGVKGVVSALANFAPKTALSMCEAESRGDYEKAKKIHSDLMPLFKTIWWRKDGDSSRYISYVKEAMKMMGIISHSNVRPPILPLKEEERQKLEKALKAVGFLKE
ncbi:4-hydroxy-tetrahydrodipicolinate synthase [Candidatus Aerophobetes bacterium]|nr:4-hydroxy-tetrahydrodipicolinate synthase [Candidatus Aerophobetes bacterium]